MYSSPVIHGNGRDTLRGVSFLVRIRTRTYLNATRMSVAGEGFTEPLLMFRNRRNSNESPHSDQKRGCFSHPLFLLRFADKGFEPVMLSSSLLQLFLFLFQCLIELVRVLFNDGINDSPNHQIPQHKDTGKYHNRYAAPFQPVIEQIRDQIPDV